MNKAIKKGLSGDPVLKKKQKTQASRKLFSTPNVTNEINSVNSPLGKARLISVCFSCGSSKNLTKYHSAGGALSICATCKAGGLV